MEAAWSEACARCGLETLVCCVREYVRPARFMVCGTLGYTARFAGRQLEQREVYRLQPLQLQIHARHEVIDAKLIYIATTPASIAVILPIAMWGRTVCN
jgi:hypothetical protein